MDKSVVTARQTLQILLNLTNKTCIFHHFICTSWTKNYSIEMLKINIAKYCQQAFSHQL